MKTMNILIKRKLTEKQVNRIIKLYLFLLFPVLAVKGYSQGTSFVKGGPEFLNIVTPNAASFNKFIDHPISLYNGTPDVNIPIYTVKDGMIELPIALRYNTSGIKVDEEASWVGLGWNLNVGGVITRNLVGEDDARDTRYLQVIDSLHLFDSEANYIDNRYRWFIDFSGCQANFFMKYENESLTTSTGKLNPDVFYYSYPGGAGKFFIDYRDNGIYILNREDNVKIEIMNNGAPNPINTDIGRIKITTMEGIEHIFEYFSKLDNSNLLNPIPASTSFVLKKSIYPNGQQIDYQYIIRYF